MRKQCELPPGPGLEEAEQAKEEGLRPGGTWRLTGSEDLWSEKLDSSTGDSWGMEQTAGNMTLVPPHVSLAQYVAHKTCAMYVPRVKYISNTDYMMALEVVLTRYLSDTWYTTCQVLSIV